MRRFAPRLATGVASAVVVSAFAAAPLAAQVGYPTQASPYEDLDYKHSLTLLGGYAHLERDPAGVAPRSGPLLGAQYDVVIGGPISLTTRVSSILSDRTVLDPARPANRRVLGEERRPLWFADLGFTLNLTGQKSYRGVVPFVDGAVGIASRFKADDPGALHVGTAFAFAYGAGVRLAPRSRLQLRAELTNHLYQLRYPDSYFAKAIDSTSVLPTTASKSAWLSNLAITLGASYQLFR